MAGLAERAGSTEDSFWTWRETMYGWSVGCRRTMSRSWRPSCIVNFSKVDTATWWNSTISIMPWQRQAVPMASRCQCESCAAAEKAGIGLNASAGVLCTFGLRWVLRPPLDRSRSFTASTAFSPYLDRLEPECRITGGSHPRPSPSIRSRAAKPDEMQTILSSEHTSGHRPHSHCRTGSVKWRTVSHGADAGPSAFCSMNFRSMRAGAQSMRRTMTPEETVRLARSGAVAGLCPATEANLGDGIFPATDYVGHAGRYGIGTDSHVATSVAERTADLLEYGQRLRDRRRNRLVSGPGGIGRSNPVRGEPLGRRPGRWSCNRRHPCWCPADLVVLDGENPFIAAAKEDQILDRWNLRARIRSGTGCDGGGPIRCPAGASPI